MRLRFGRISPRNLQLISLLALALIPVGLFGLVATGHLGGAVTANADRDTGKTLDAVQAVLSQREQDLSTLAGTYAGWDQLQSHVGSNDAAWVKNAVLDFVVAHGTADAAAISAQRPISSGPSNLVEAMLARMGTPWNGSPAVDLFAAPDGVYELALAPVPGLPSGSNGRPAAIALAKRLDEHFVTQAASMTGWDVAIARAGGTISVATRLAPFQDLGVLPPTAGTALKQTHDFAGGGRPIVDASGRIVGLLLVATDLGALGSISDQLLGLLAITLAPAVIAALALSLLLSLRLRRRVAAVAAANAAVAAGDFSVRLPEGNLDEFERLASSHNRLAGELERRDRTLSRLLDSLVSLRPNEGVARVAREGVGTIVEVFGLGRCELIDGDGTSLAMAGSRKVAGPPDETVQIERGNRRWELCWSGVPAGWSQADEGLLELYAGQLGTALQDAELHEKTAAKVRALDRVNRLQADFLRGVSHNLQSPLTAIVGLSDELRSRSDVAPDAQARADVIHADAQRLRMLVRQLLTMSRLEAGTLQVELELCSVEPILKRAWAAHRSVRPFEIVNTAAGALAVADPQALEQVAWILFDNAIRYAPKGPIRVEIGYGHGRLSVRVEDEGPGVSPSERSSIFRRFGRGSTSAGHDGTGLGLDVARGLLRAMDGRIRYEPGRVGAAFVVELQAEVASASV